MSIVLVSGRNCDGCALCCKLPEIKPLKKSAGEWCTHCSTRKACDAYDTRPQPCRDFYCGWLTEPGIGDEWKPLVSRMMVRIGQGGDHLFILVDPARPDAWRKQPYYTQLKSWARANNARGQQIIVNIAGRYIIIFPDREEDIGVVADDETVSFSITHTPNGPVTQVQKVKL